MYLKEAFWLSTLLRWFGVLALFGLEIPFFRVVHMILMAASLLIWFFKVKCPNCGRHLYNDFFSIRKGYYEYCPYCGEEFLE